MTARHELSALLVVCLLVFCTGLGDIPFYTRGEPREGNVAREMLRTGEWLVPSRPDGELARKPPLYYWLAASALSAVPGSPELALRLPSALLASGGVLATWAATHRLVGPAAALPAAVVLATSFEWTRAAVSARVDMALAVPLALVVLVWMAALREPTSRGAMIVAGVAAGLATLAKGPVALVLPALAAVGLAAVRRDVGVLRRLHVVGVLAVGAALAAGWYAAAVAAHGERFVAVVLQENVRRFVDSEDAGTGHAHGLLYLPLLGLVGVLPWTPLLPLAAAALPRRRQGDAARTLAAVWCAVVLGFFSLADAKRSVYLLPLFPALAMLVAAGAAEPPRDGRLATAVRWTTAVYAPALVLLAAVAGVAACGVDVAAPVRAWLDPRDAAGADVLLDAVRGTPVPIALLALGTLAAVPFVARLRRRAAWRDLLLVIASVSVVWIVAFDAVIHPAIGRARGLRDFMARVDRDVPRDAVLHVFRPVDPGLRFYAPRRLAPWSAAPDAGPRWLLVWDDELERLRDASGRPLAPLDESRARDPRRGSLALVDVPPGALVRR